MKPIQLVVSPSTAWCVSKLTLESSEKKFNKAARIRKDEKMLTTLDGVDLKVKDFRKHAKYYNEYN